MPNEPIDHEEKMRVLTQLLNSPGWSLFVHQAQITMQNEYALSFESNAHAMALHLGAHRAIGDLVGWPLREIEATNRVFQAEAEEQQQKVEDKKRLRGRPLPSKPPEGE